EPGILLRSDTVWTPVNVLSRGFVASACSRAPSGRCATIAGQRLSFPPEGPAIGIVFRTTEPLFEIEPFPDDVQHWTSEVSALQLDPELCHSIPEWPTRWEEGEPRWMHVRHNRTLYDHNSGLEAAFDGAVGARIDEKGLVMSGGIRAGIWTSWSAGHSGFLGN